VHFFHINFIPLLCPLNIKFFTGVKVEVRQRTDQYRKGENYTCKKPIQKLKKYRRLNFFHNGPFMIEVLA
jgi:hypothetical protein